MADPKPKAEKTKVTVLIGEYTHGKIKRKIYSRMLETVATKLGVPGKKDGFLVISKIAKGNSKGAQVESYILGGASQTYTLYYGIAKKTVVVGKKTVGTYYRKVNIPVPAGTPLAVVAAFAKKLKAVPSKIGTPTGKVHFFSKSKAQ